MNIEDLQNNRLFIGMDAEEIRSALDCFRAARHSYQKGETILRAGGRTDCVCLVLSGSVAVESNDIWGNRTILNIMETGDFFAETYAILREEAMLVDAVANEACAILFLHVGILFCSGCDAHPWSYKLLRNFLVISARKNLMLSGRSFHTSPKTARGRIMAYLNSVSLKKQSLVFDIPFDRQQLADYLNLERTVLSKELGRMKKEGILDFRKNHFRILE